jgi:hypothetical protein
MNELVRQWLIEVLGYDAQHVIRANHHLVAGVTSQYSHREDANNSPPDDDIAVTYYNRGEYTYQIDLYDSDGMTLQHNLAQSGYLLDVRNILQPYYTVHWGAGAIQDLTALVDTKHKARYQCDHTFRLWNTITEVESKISNGYVITGKYQPDNEDVVIEVP